MNLKKIFMLMLVALTAITSSCKYDDDELWDYVTNLADRISSLETLTKQMNSDIAAMQSVISALENKVYVSQVEKLTDGYIIHFSDGTNATIKNGVDGTDGTNAPVVGVKQNNGVYYWTITIDDKTTWLTDEKGNKLPVSGIAGEDGINGKNGVTPLLKVDNDGYWMVSYNNGSSYTYVLDSNGDKVYAVGPQGPAGNNGAAGSNGSNGKDGDSYFDDVEVDGNKVIITIDGIDYEFIASIDVTSIAQLLEGTKSGDKISIYLSEDLIIGKGESFTIPEGVEVTMDLNGETLTIATGREASNVDALINNGTLILKNGEIEAENDENSRRCVYNYGEMVIDGVEFTQTYGRKGAAINNEGKMTIKNATVNAVYYSVWNSGTNAELTIENGSFVTTNDTNITDTWSYCLNNQNGAKLTINGGTFIGNHGVVASVGENSKVVMNAGTYICTGVANQTDWILYAGNKGSIEYSSNCILKYEDTDSSAGGGVSTTISDGTITTF